MGTGPVDRRRTFSRRQVLGMYAASTFAVTAGAAALERDELFAWTGSPELVLPGSVEVARAEERRFSTGRLRSFELRAEASEIELGGQVAATWAFGGSVPFRELRVNVGDIVRARLVNSLPEPTSVHWHGLALRNDMDGVPGVTQQPVSSGSSFNYEFVAPHAGTYWFHPHVGVQLDRGLYGPLIIEDPDEPLKYDDEVVLILDDWTDGIGQSPDALLASMATEGMQGPMSAPGSGSVATPTAGRTSPLGEDTGDVRYPLHLINGRAPRDPLVVRARPRQRLRLRIINAASDTAYRVAVGGHRLSVVHTDGFPTQPAEGDAIILGMGERYDVLLDTDDGAFPIVARPEGKPDPAALAILRTSAGATPSAEAPELDRQVIGYRDLAPAPSVELPPAPIDRAAEVRLTMGDGGRSWLMNGKRYGEHDPIRVTGGERVRLDLVNDSMMFHPMHLHGHTFALQQAQRPGLRKDTVNVVPNQKLSIVLDADNPGQWLLHCHNVYHGELGMMSILSYVADRRPSGH